MKIKKVEIQAFRVYDDVANSTFDFMTESGDVAGFISIHAPNGFGKTSFYDAVEWSFTNKITRYDRRKGFNSDLAKSERANSVDDEGKRKHQLILRNKFSDLDEGFVNLYTTLDEIPYSRIIPKVNKGVPDYKFEEQDIEDGTEHFHEVMLSQEWIDAFLKEDNAEERYEKFVSSFGDVSLNKKYKAIVDLINLNKSNISSLRKGVKDLVESDKTKYDSDFLEIINSEIENVNDKGCDFPSIKPDFSEKDDYKFVNVIRDKLDFLSSKLSGYKNHINKINMIKAGAFEGLVSLKSYFNLKNKLIQNELELKGLSKLKIDFNNRLENQVRVQDVKGALLLNSPIIDEYKSLINIFPQYKLIENKVVDAKLELSEISVAKFKLKESIEEGRGKENELSVSLEGENSLLNKIISNKKSISDVFNDINKGEKGLLDLTLVVIKQKSFIQDFSTSIEKVKRKIVDVNNAIEMINEDIYILDGNIYFDIYENEISVIKQQEYTIKNMDDNVVSINDRIEEVASLNDELKNLLDLGVKVISGSEMSECPLCQNSYDSYSELMEKVSKNPLLKDELRRLTVERAGFQKKYDDFLNSRKIKKSNLLVKLNECLDTENAALNRDNAKLDSLTVSIKENQVQIKKAQLETERLRLSVDNLDKEGYLYSITKKISDQTKRFQEIDSSFNTIKLEVSKCISGLKLLEVKEKNAKDRIEFFSNELNFKNIENFGKEYSLSDSESYLAALKELILEKNNDISEGNVELRKLEADISSLNEILPSSEMSYYEDKIHDKEVAIKNIVSDLYDFDVIVKSIFNLESLNGVNVEDQLEISYQSYLNEVDSTEKLISNIEKVERYKSNVIPFLKSERNKSEKERLEKEIEFLSGAVFEELIREKAKLSAFIDKKIESFFYKDLINTLYKKIDPHPRYSEMSFECDFSQDKPRLNVFVSNDVDGEAIVPTLYFSTAQLNILSLSIFLAKALNTTDNSKKPIDCIFIDDPIQSMDSINILSTIDLFRSIVMNMGKQIILSTHDENFHNLLKKKMPKGLFKSKFIEFESFGKLKKC
jgi:exonuclease SbcC